MELILASADGREEKTIFDDIDLEIGEENTFEITLDYPAWDGSLKHGKRIYVPGTEYGGIIKDIEGATNTDQIFVRGFTWRGYLAHRIIEPPSGEDYRKVSGELNTVIRTILSSVLSNSLTSMFRVSSESTGVSVTNFQFNRYVSAADGITAMLASKGYRLDIRYIQTELSGYVLLSAQPAENHGDDIEISQDSRLDFASQDYRMGCNHLICMGIGELRNRTIVHLYADKNGTISQTKTITGIEEIVETYDNPAAEEDILIELGTEYFKELLNYKKFEAAYKDIDDLDLPIGDTITGRDYITGNVVTKPITRKIIRRENGIVTTEYKIEGET